MAVRQKTALITGCTPGGIGFAVAQEFRAKGFHVIATVRNKQLMEELAQNGLTALHLDVTDEASIAACLLAVQSLPWFIFLTSRLMASFLSGRGLVTPATDITLSSARAVYETNVFAPMAMVAAFTPLLIPTKGLIINIVSASALVPYVFGSVYASSKAALASYSRTIRAELRPFGVRVMAVMAGTVKSNMGSSATGHLPDDSLYDRVRHLYEARLGFSQKVTSVPMSTATFARKLVGDALKREVPGLFRTWFGRPDWFYYGGMSGLVWWGSFLGEWVFDLWAWRTFKLSELQVMMEQEVRAGKGV